MLSHRFVMQPFKGSTYLELFAAAYRYGPFTNLDVAVAYATMGGAEAIVSEFARLDPVGWSTIRKRWLIGVDWCRTDPVALDQLDGLPNSAVQIPSGARLVEIPGCTPKTPFHPKAFILRGDRSVAVICGSGNLSRNGLTRGHELGTAVVATWSIAEP